MSEGFPGGTSGTEPAGQCGRHKRCGFDPLEEGMETHSSILAWRISVDIGASWATVHRVAKSQTGLNGQHTRTHARMHTHTHTHLEENKSV